MRTKGFAYEEKKRRKETCCDNVIYFVGKKGRFYYYYYLRESNMMEKPLSMAAIHTRNLSTRKKVFFFCSVGSFLGKEVIVLGPINLSSDGHSPKYVRSQSLWQCQSKSRVGSKCNNRDTIEPSILGKHILGPKFTHWPEKKMSRILRAVLFVLSSGHQDFRSLLSSHCVYRFLGFPAVWRQFFIAWP